MSTEQQETKGKSSRDIVDEKYVRLVESAQAQVDRAWKFYAGLGSVIVLGGGILMSLLRMNFSTDFDKLRSNAKQDFEEYKNELARTTKERVDEELKTPKIQAMIAESVSNRVTDAFVSFIQKEAQTVARTEAKQIASEEALKVSAQEAKRITAEQFEPRLKDLQQKQELLDLIIKAESGELKALKELERMGGMKLDQYGSPDWSKEPEQESRRVARTVCARLYLKLNESHISTSQYTFFTETVDTPEVIAFLGSQDAVGKIVAIHTIKARGLKDQIPRLIALLEKDENIYVLEAATRVLNHFLFGKYTNPMAAVRVLDPDAPAKFRAKWEEKKKELSEKK